MPSLGQILSRTFFWSYERGSWQYDIAVVLILIFVLLTPSHWFHDQPDQASANSSPAGSLVQLLSAEGEKQTYRVDSRVLALPERIPALENELHNAMQKSLPDLRNGRFSIAKIEAVRDEQGTVIAFRVEIHH
jgi:hypothetical protein